MPATYGLYLRSDAWRTRADAALRRAGHRCMICNADRWFTPLEVHHRTYERLGAERPGDLVVLCSHCHGLFHAFGKLAR